MNGICQLLKVLIDTLSNPAIQECLKNTQEPMTKMVSSLDATEPAE